MIPNITAMLAASTIAIAMIGPAGNAHANDLRLAADILNGDRGGYYEPAPYGRYDAPGPVYAEPGPVPPYGVPPYGLPPRPRAPLYAMPGPGYEPAPPCYWTRGEPVWDGYRWRRPRVQVCD